MKIDLHCHTKKIKKGENAARNATLALFVEKIEAAKVGIVAITNHNHFDIDQYREFSTISNFTSDCLVWPGVELDIINKNSKQNAHLILVSNPNSVEQFDKSISILLTGKDPDTLSLDIEYVLEIMKNCDLIYIPHYHGKANQFSDEMINTLKENLNDETRLFHELSNFRSAGVYTNHGYRVLFGSDVQDWNEYEKCQFANLRLEVDSFEKFCMLAKKDTTVIDSILNKKQFGEIKTYPHSSNCVKLTFFEDINIIFGQKGTGKSEIIKSIEAYCKSKNIRYSSYYGSQKAADFDELLNCEDIDRSCGALQISERSEDFILLKSWTDTLPTPLHEYITWKETANKNRNKARMKITETSELQLPEKQKIKQLAKDLAGIKEISTLLAGIDLTKYFTTNNALDLDQLIKNLCTKILETYTTEWIDVEATKLVNFSIKTIQHNADKATDSKSRPTTPGLFTFYENRSALYDALKGITSAFMTPEKTEYSDIGRLDDKGDISIKTTIRLLCDDSRREEYPSTITRLKRIKSKINQLYNSFYTENIYKSIETITIELQEADICNLSDFIGLSRTVVDVNGDIYNPSNGEKGILMMQKLLNEDSTFYLLDEPELGMGNSYINAIIVPRLVALGKARKAVIIATHNANIAVRTMPYLSIYRTHMNGIFKTYIGNPFSNKLTDINDSTDVLNWSIESLNTLEGGADAFDERKCIYEAGKQDN